jgi:hypothetical protein
MPKKFKSDNLNEEVAVEASILPEEPIQEEVKEVIVKMPENNPDLKSPKDWAIITGNGPTKNSNNLWDNGKKNSGRPKGMSRQLGTMAHECASILHGWKEHEHQAGGPILLTKEDYELALKAAMCEEGNPVPHAPALSPHKGGGVKVYFKG